MELYIHIPFCRAKCRYCDFPSYPGCDGLMPEYIEALLLEAETKAQALGRPEIETVFIGGGTPSLLPPELLSRLSDGLHRSFPFRPGAEFTSEANPGTLTEEWLDTAARCGVNRLSMGMQAAQPRLLKLLGRIHTPEQVIHSVELARRAGISELNLDLMFGLPTQTEAEWQETLSTALQLSPRHLSCYGLIVEEGTPIAADIDAGRLILPEEDAERRMYDYAISTLAAAGLMQYEISNFALPGHECRHNLGYWQQVPYLGLGSSAASMLPDPTGQAFCLRTANPPEPLQYIAMVHGNGPARESLPVSREEARFETMMLSLRTTEGVSEKSFLQMHGLSLTNCYGEKLNSLIRRGLLRHQDGRYALTRRGMDIQNSILVELMDD